MYRFLLSSLVLFAACAAPVPPADAPPSAYLPDRVMVRPAAGIALEGVLAPGTRILGHRGASPYALVEAEPGEGPGLIASLRRDRRVAEAWPVGRVVGNGSDLEPAAPEAWHLEAARVPPTTEMDGLVVAVLDSGVAYAERTDGGRTWAQAPSLSGVDFVAPWDFVDDDPWPHDEHQHGTLIASLIASQGAVRGAAPGAGVMPLRVLDETNSGHELALIDALHWAVDHDADLVNMSLGFPPGYMPSRPLLEALQRAADAGVVMIGSAGNHGQATVTWPAASPLVIATGAATPDTRPGHPGAKRGRDARAPRGRPARGGDGPPLSRHLLPTDYTGRHAAIDLLAPGGDLSADRTGDGWPDGLLSESIFPGDPSRTGTWLSAGTSQATAMTSAAALHMLAAGVPPQQVGRTLQVGSWPGITRDAPYLEGLGAGTLDIAAALTQGQRPLGGTTHAALLPWLSADGRPAARITVMDQAGDPVDDATVVGTFTGATQATAQCTLIEGACTLHGPPAGPGAHAWMISVDAVVRGRAAWRPGGALFAADTLEVLLAALAEHPDLQDAVLALHWADEEHDDLGEMAESWAVVDTGTGLATSPVGLLLTAEFVAAHATSEPVTVDLEGTGLATSPVGLHRMRLFGTGLATSPLFGADDAITLAVIEGNGLATSPVGFGGDSLYAELGVRWDSPSIALDGAPLLLSSGTLVGVDPGDTWTGAWIDDGGWTADGYPAASLLGAAAVPPPTSQDATWATGALHLQE